MNSENLLENIEVIPKFDKETELIKFIAEQPSGAQVAVQVTNLHIIVYSDKDYKEEDMELPVKGVKAIVLNGSHDQVLIKTKDDKAVCLRVENGESVTRTVFAAAKSKHLDVYAVEDEDLTHFYESRELPKKSCLLKRPARTSSETTGSSDDQNKIRKSEIELEAGEEEKLSSSSSDTEPEFDDDESEITRGKSKCFFTKETLDNFSLLKVIGKGAFGKVFLSKNKEGEIFAMKRIRKDKVLRYQAVESILLERKILSEINHPLLLGLKHVFSSDTRLYFFCDYVVGGDLMRHLKRMPQGFTLPQVKFIAAQLVLAFECLHSNGLAHRDLKPENVLIDQEGYIRLADFGLAKDLNEGVGKGSCGTLEYMAPEIIEATEEGHKYEVDWWTLGILMYELYYGVTPFLAGSRKEIMDNISNNDPEFPKKAGETSEKSFKNFKKIVTKLLHKNPAKRLGHSKKGEGAKKVKKQSFFKNVDWSNILTKEYEAPYVPKLNLKKLEKYLEEEGCEIGVTQSDKKHHKGLVETALNTKIKNGIIKYGDKLKISD